MNTDRIDIGLPKNIRIQIGDLTVDFYTESEVTQESGNAPAEIHFHAMFEFQYIHEGTMAVATEKKSIVLQEDDFVLIPPYVPHSTEGVPGEFRRYVFSFSLSRENRAPGVFSEFEYYNTIFEAMDDVMLLQEPEIRRCVKRIRGMEGLAADFVQHKAKLELSLLLTELAEAIRRQQPLRNEVKKDKKKALSEDGQRKWVIESYVSRYYQQEDPTGRLMEVLCMSRRNTDRVVRKLMGESLHSLILRQRMMIAREMLEKSSMRLNEVAEAVGYQSYVGFYTAFRNYYGFAPDQLRHREELNAGENNI